MAHQDFNSARGTALPRLSRSLAQRRRAAPTLPPSRLALAAALALTAGTVLAQTETTVQTVTVSGSAQSNAASVAGFGDVPLYQSPFAATVITTAQLSDAGIASLADITLLDAGITDAYNAPGYWNTLAVRGFTVDPQRNMRRDGLPINGETVIALGNKSALEVLKGTSGIQAGTSAPGGLINFVVARPVDRIREASVSLSQAGTYGASMDLGDRAGTDGAIGWRLRVDAEHLDPRVRNTEGERHLLAGAVEWQLGQRNLLEAELEFSRQSQPSVPGFSLLSSALPDADTIDPKLNLNNQAWSLPVVFKGSTGSLRFTHSYSPALKVVAHAMHQRLITDDRIAFPYGCSSGTVYLYTYCADGSFDFYDYRSDGEKRTADALDLSVHGDHTLGGMRHQWQAGVLFSRNQAVFGPQAYNWVGVGTIDGLAVVPPDASTYNPDADRRERSTEWRLQDRISLSTQWQLWAGLRHTRLHREGESVYDQSLTTPWLAVSWTPDAANMVYASAGQGMESEAVPNLPAVYSNAGDVLPALKSQQIELGWKHRGGALDWQLTAFDIERPQANDVAGARVIDGESRHTGIEAEAEWRMGALSLRGSATWLRARRQGSADASLNGLRPTNVPQTAIKLQAAYNVRQLPGLAVLGFVTHEGERMVLPDNSVATPGWTRLDLAARYRHRLHGHDLTWRVGLDNVADTRAWKEAPYQFGHAYLYPLAPRTLHASLNVRF